MKESDIKKLGIKLAQNMQDPEKKDTAMRALSVNSNQSMDVSSTKDIGIKFAQDMQKKYGVTPYQKPVSNTQTVKPQVNINAPVMNIQPVNKPVTQPVARPVIDPLDEDALRINMANNRTEPTAIMKAASFVGKNLYNNIVKPAGQAIDRQYEKLDDYNFGEKALNDAYRIAQENSQSAWDEETLRLQRLKNDYDKLLSYMTPEQKVQYSRLPENKKKDYLDGIMAQLQTSKGAARAEEIRNIQDKTNQNLQKIGLSFESGMGGFKTGLKGVYNLMRGADETVAKNASEYAFDELRPETKGALGVAMDLSNTVGNMAPSIALGLVGGPLGVGALGTAAMGVSSAGKGYDSAIGEGYTPEQAAAYGVASGVSEALLQKIAGALPGVSNAQGLVTRFLGKYGDDVLSKVVSNPSLRKALVTLLGNAASEGSEEGAQEIIDTFIRNAVLGEDNNINWKDVGYSALLGGMTGGAFALPGGVSTVVNRDSNIDTAQPTPETVENTVDAVQNDVEMPEEVTEGNTGAEPITQEEPIEKMKDLSDGDLTATYSPTIDELKAKPAAKFTEITTKSEIRTMDNETFKEFYKTVKNKVKSLPWFNKPILNNDTDFATKYGNLRARVTDNTLKKGHSYSTKYGIEQIEIMEHLDELFKNGTVIDMKQDTKGDKRVNRVITLLSPFRLSDGKTGVVKLNVKEPVDLGQYSRIHENKILDITDYEIMENKDINAIKKDAPFAVHDPEKLRSAEASEEDARSTKWDSQESEIAHVASFPKIQEVSSTMSVEEMLKFVKDDDLKYLHGISNDFSDGAENAEDKDMFVNAGIVDEAKELNKQYGRSFESEEINNKTKQLKLFDDEDIKLSDPRITISDEGLKLFTEVSNTIDELKKKKLQIEHENPLTDGDKNRVKAIVAMGGDISSVSGIENLGGVKAVVAINKELADYEKLKRTMVKEQREVNNAIAIEAMQATGGFKSDIKNLKLSLETPERIFEDISRTKEGAEYLKDTYTRAMKQNEAQKTKFFNKIANIVDGLKIDDKKKYTLEINPFLPSGERSDIIEKVTVTEQGLVQIYGEGIINEAQLKEVGADVEHIKKAAETIRDIYDDLLVLVNKARITAGYEPIQKRSNYFPHFTELAPKTPFEKVMHVMSMDITQSELPVEIAGLTEAFKPGKKYETYSNKREGVRSTYNAAKGLEMYLNTASDVIFHTQDIQKLRGLERMTRFEYSSDTIKQKVQDIWEDTNKDEDAKNAEVNAIYEAASTSLPGFVNYLTRYTNSLAGKKSYGIDRDLEFMFGRQVYTTAVKVADRVAANMVAGNISSAMTNFIPIPKVIAKSDAMSLGSAIMQTVFNAFDRNGGDGLMDRSNFYVSRMGKDRIYYEKAWGDKLPVSAISETLGIPFDIIDSFSTEVVVRAIYNNKIKAGYTPEAAMKYADEWSGKLMADRSYGARPMIFETKALKPLTMFGIESLNDLEFVFRDLPMEDKEKGAIYIGGQLLKVFLGTFLFNELYESFFGRRPTLDPIDMGLEAVATGFGYNRNNLLKESVEGLKNSSFTFEGNGNGFEAFTPRAGGGSVADAVTNFAGDVIENIPIVGSVMGGGRLPVTNIVPEIKLGEDVPTTAKNIGKELLGTTGAYMLSPFGAGSQISKTVRGYDAYRQGGMKSETKEGEKLKFPIEKSAYNAIAALIGGPYATKEGKEYIERGMPQISVERTKNYYKVVEAGITYPQYITAMQAIKGIESDKDKDGNTIKYSKDRNKKAAIDEAVKDFDLSEKQKEILYEANDVSEKVW